MIFPERVKEISSSFPPYLIALYIRLSNIRVSISLLMNRYNLMGVMTILGSI